MAVGAWEAELAVLREKLLKVEMLISSLDPQISIMDANSYSIEEIKPQYTYFKDSEDDSFGTMIDYMVECTDNLSEAYIKLADAIDQYMDEAKTQLDNAISKKSDWEARIAELERLIAEYYATLQGV